MNINEETLLKPIHTQTDKVMMTTLGLLLMVSIFVGLFYDELFITLLICIPSFVVPFLIWKVAPRTFLLRIAIATGLVFNVAVHIQVSHGLIEMHFGVFAILAFLLAYRDWRIIVYAAALVAIHHLALNFLQASNDNIWLFKDGTSFGMVFVHAGFVIFESSILVMLAIQFERELIRLAFLANTAELIADGDLSTKINSDHDDFVGLLLHSMERIQDSLNHFVIAQRELAKKHSQGFISERIDSSQLSGVYSDIANEINQLVKSHIDVKMQVVEVVSQYARGDFSKDFERLPAEKAKITTAIDAVKTALLAISKEIEILSAAGAVGDFSKRGNAEDFEFIFKDMLINLNNLMSNSETMFRDILKISNALAMGDLTQQISVNYPQGTFRNTTNALNGTVENLRALVGEIKASSDVINTAAQEIAAGNNDLSMRTEKQAASLEETAASMQELTSTVQANSDNAKHANQMALSSSDIARKGVAVVNQVVKTMEDINESSRKVVDIITVIDGIAFQTNILALNAAVEAARAGEQGRGFAVVASEVRNLAQRAASAAGEIKSLISDSVDKVEDGTDLVAHAGKTMEEIVNSIQNVTATIAQISSASFEQTTGIQQVNLAIGEMDDVTQQNAALVEEAAAAAESLEQQARQLTITVANFNTSIPSIEADKPLPKMPNSSASPVKQATKTFEPAKNIESIDIDLDSALKKHAEWKIKLRAAISNKEILDAEMISKDDCCDLGKWLHSSDSHSKVSHLNSYNDCITKHAAFHVAAGKVAAVINAKKYDQADKLLGNNSDFVNASSEVGKAIMRLKKDTTAKVIESKTSFDDEWEEF